MSEKCITIVARLTPPAGELAIDVDAAGEHSGREMALLLAAIRSAALETAQQVGESAGIGGDIVAAMRNYEQTGDFSLTDGHIHVVTKK